MTNETATWIDLIISFIAAIATPVSIIVAIKQYKKSFSFEIESDDKSIKITLINECPFPLLITELYINNQPFLDNSFILTGNEAKQICFSNESLKGVITNKNRTISVLICCTKKKKKRKIIINEIKF